MARLEEKGLRYLRVVMHPGDAEEVRQFAKKLYEKRGIELEPDTKYNKKESEGK